MEENNDQSTESADVQQSHAETAATTLPAGQVEPIALDPAARFRGNGASFKAKLIGIDDVPESRGDKMCQESILKLKGAVKASGQHKPKIMVNVSMKGLRIINLMNGEIEHEHPVHRISFIARDLTDRRAFGYVYGAGEGKHKFFGIKTAKIAENLVLALRDLFQVVYDEKKKEMEEAKQKQSENGEEGTGNSEEVYAVPNNRPVPQQRNLLDIQQQLDNMHEIRASDAFNPWPENAPVSPDTPGSPLDSDMFGMQNGNQQTGVPRGSSADDLAAIFSSEASQPAPAPGAKMTKDQILAGFVTAPSAMPGMQHGMYQQTPAFGAQPSYGAAAQPGYGAAAQPGYGAAAQPGYGAAAQPGYGAAAQPGYIAAARPGFGVAAQPQMSNPFNSGLAAGQSAYGQPAMGMFPSGPSPAVPARPGAMRPPTAVPAQTGAAQNPFGDALVPSANLLAPQSSYPVAQQNGSGGNDIAEKNDPFASLLPGIGSGSGSGSSNATNKKDMFKNFQMAKPAPPPRSGENVSANFENYMRNTVGGVPLQSDVTNSNPLAAAAPPVAAPRSTAADPFGGAPSSGTAGNGNDPFGMFNSPSSNFDQPFNFSNQQPPAANTQQSLFG